jgi:hypothetical protein
MEIDKVLAVYRVSPLLLVVEAGENTLLELSLGELKEAGHRLSDVAWKRLMEDYQIFNCSHTPR